MNIELTKILFFTQDFSGYTAKIDGAECTILHTTEPYVVKVENWNNKQFLLVGYNGEYTVEQVSDFFQLSEMMGDFCDFFNENIDKKPTARIGYYCDEKQYGMTIYCNENDTEKQLFEMAKSYLEMIGINGEKFEFWERTYRMVRKS